MKKIITSIFIVCLLATVISCEKNEEEPRFKLKYILVNQSEYSLASVAFYTSTYFPKQDSTIWASAVGYPVNNKDTVHLEVPRLGYVGCKMDVVARVTCEFDSGLLEFRDYQLVKTVNKTDDNILQFNWPTDTLTAKRIY